MLPRKYKLSLNKDFEKTFKAGRSVYGRFLGFKLRKNDLDYSRFGLLLGIKIEKSAVKRHVLKRRVYTILEKERLNLSIPSDCVIIALAGIKDATITELRHEILEMFAKINK